MMLSLPFLICAAALGFVLAVGALVLPDRRGDRPARDRDHEPKHAPLPKRVPLHARTAFADPRDTADPDGSVWLRSLAEPAQGAPLEPLPPLPPRAPRPALETLERVRAGLLALPVAGELEMLPPDPEPEPEPEPAPEPEWGSTAWRKAEAEALERWLDENVRSVPIPEYGGYPEGRAA